MSEFETYLRHAHFKDDYNGRKFLIFEGEDRDPDPEALKNLKPLSALCVRLAKRYASKNMLELAYRKSFGDQNMPETYEGLLAELTLGWKEVVKDDGETDHVILHTGLPSCAQITDRSLAIMDRLRIVIAYVMQCCLDWEDAALWTQETENVLAELSARTFHWQSDTRGNTLRVTRTIIFTGNCFIYSYDVDGKPIILADNMYPLSLPKDMVVTDTYYPLLDPKLGLAFLKDFLRSAYLGCPDPPADRSSSV